MGVIKKVGNLIDTLNIRSLSKTYRKGRIQANNEISIRFEPGVITALTGHNGAGKTTLLKQIMGIIRPDSGTITYRGHSFINETESARANVALMPQFHVPLSGVTVKQSIGAALRIRGVSNLNIKNFTSKIMRDLKIEDWANTSGEKLSGGLQRLTSFAMTVAVPLPIVMLDEPTNDVDPIRRVLMWQHLRKLANQGCIVIIVTHNLLEVEQYADRMLLLDHGKVIKDDATNLTSLDGLSTAKLEVIARTIFNKSELPVAFKTIVDEANHKYSFQLKSDQLISITKWLTSQIENGKILHYDLSPLSINDVYREATNGENA